MFLDFKPSNQQKLEVDGCVLFDGRQNFTTLARADILFDDIHYYGGGRVCCLSLPNIRPSDFETHTYEIGLTLEGVPYAPRIPLQQVSRQCFYLCCKLGVIALVNVLICKAT